MIQVILTALAILISIGYLVNKFFFQKPEKGCGNGSCDCD